MKNLLKNPAYLITFLGIHFTTTTFCQFSSDLKHDSFGAFKFIRKNDSNKRSSLSIEATPAILGKAKINKEQGKYQLKSHLQSAYDLGVNYLYNVNKNLKFIIGFHFIVGKRNFFAHIPPADINNRDGRYYIEEKELWGSFRIPILIETKILKKQENALLIKAGFNFRYSGLMPDEGYSVATIDSNNQITDVFNAQISARNNRKPWITVLAGVSKSFLLDNKNILALGLQTDISTTYFLKSNYEFTIPNQPVATGTYKINGSSIGLSVQYIFTGSNKQIIKLRKTKKDSHNSSIDSFKKDDVLKKYVFKGNHIQFNFALPSAFKARLKNISGNHPVSTSGAPGLLLSIKYQINFNPKYGLITGPEATLIGRDFKTSFSKNDFSPPLIADYSTKGLSQDMVLSLPVMVEKRCLYSESKFLFVNAGLRLNFSLGADSDIYSIYLLNTSNGTYNAAEVDVYSNNNARPWISFPINVGHAWLRKNNNLLQLALCSNFSFTKYVNGTYQINIPNRPATTGSYSSTGSFVGLSLNYVFTNTNYRIRKTFEEKEKN